MIADVQEAKELKFINMSFENSGSKEDFIKKVSIYIVF